MPHYVTYSIALFYGLFSIWGLYVVIQILIHLDDKYPRRMDESSKVFFLLWLVSLVFVINYIITGGT